MLPTCPTCRNEWNSAIACHVIDGLHSAEKTTCKLIRGCSAAALLISASDGAAARKCARGGCHRWPPLAQVWKRLHAKPLSSTHNRAVRATVCFFIFQK